MVKCNDLSEKDRIFLYRCVVRIHKEYGSFIEFKQHNDYSRKNFAKKISYDVHSYLVKTLWKTAYSFFCFEGGDIVNEIKSSVLMIYLIDLIKGNAILSGVCQDIVLHEFSYIDGLIAEKDSEEENIKLDKETVSVINNLWEKYKIFGQRGLVNLVNIPIKNK